MTIPRPATAGLRDGGRPGLALAPSSRLGLANAPRTRPRPVPGSPIRSSLPPAAIDLGLGAPTWGARLLMESGLVDRPSAAWSILGPAELGYSAHAGAVELRRAVAAFEGVDEENVLITSGAQGALWALSRAFLGPRRVALVPDPGFPAYRALAELAGATVHTYGLGPGFRLDSAAVARALDALPPAREGGVLFLNAPANPTGASGSAEALAAIVELCEERGVLVVSDEVYRPLGGRRVGPGLRSSGPRGVVVGSISKGWSMPGLRVGWMLADADLLEPCRRMHAWAVTSASGPAQALAAQLLRQSADLLDLSRRHLEERWQRAEEVWRAVLGSPMTRPDGGFYLWLPLSAEHGTSAAIRCRLAEHAGVGVVAGSAFGAAGEGWIRLSVSASPDALAEGLERALRGLLALDPSWPELLGRTMGDIR